MELPPLHPIPGKKAGSWREDNPHEALLTHAERFRILNKCHCCHHWPYRPRVCSGCCYRILSAFPMKVSMGACLSTPQCCLTTSHTSQQWILLLAKHRREIRSQVLILKV